jgi:hypothetical protein
MDTLGHAFPGAMVTRCTASQSHGAVKEPLGGSDTKTVNLFGKLVTRIGQKVAEVFHHF